MVKRKRNCEGIGEYVDSLFGCTLKTKMMGDTKQSIRIIDNLNI